jgi:hypothetical protein
MTAGRLTDASTHVASDRETVGYSGTIESFPTTMLKVAGKVDAFISPFSAARRVDGTSEDER